MPPSSYNVVANSTFLDAFGALAVGPGNPAPDIQTLPGQHRQRPGDGRSRFSIPCWARRAIRSSLLPDKSDTPINVALMVERAAPQSTLDALLGGDWADRQSFIASQGDTIWSTFGANPADLRGNTETGDPRRARQSRPARTTPMTLAAEQGYIASAENRTIWLTLTPDQFNTLFNSTLLGADGMAWTGPLSLPSTIPLDTIAGLWVDRGTVIGNPVLAASVPPNPPSPAAGPASIGNSAKILADEVVGSRHHRAGLQRLCHAGRDRRLLQFPAADRAVGAAPIALVETGLDQPNLLAR